MWFSSSPTTSDGVTRRSTAPPGSIKTPNLERLAKRGMLFSRAYSASPLVLAHAGKHPDRPEPGAHRHHRAELPPARGQTEGSLFRRRRHLTKRPSSAKASTRLDTSYFTLAEALKQAGYATAHFGKWHLGAEPYSPLAAGIRRGSPTLPGPGPAGSYVAPWKFKDFVERNTRRAHRRPHGRRGRRLDGEEQGQSVFPQLLAVLASTRRSTRKNR